MDKKWLQRKQQLIPTKSDVALLDTHDPLVYLKMISKPHKSDGPLVSQIQPDLHIHYTYNIKSDELFGDIVSDMQKSCSNTLNMCDSNDRYYNNIVLNI